MDKIEIGRCGDCIFLGNCMVREDLEYNNCSYLNFGCTSWKEKEQHTTYYEWVYKLKGKEFPPNIGLALRTEQDANAYYGSGAEADWHRKTGRSVTVDSNGEFVSSEGMG